MSAPRPIRALVVSEFWAGATARSLVPALTERGWRVDRLDTRDFFPGTASLAGRIAARLLRDKRSRRFNAAILDAARTSDFDVFLTVKGTDIGANTIRALQAAGLFCANYYPDYHFNDIGIDTVATYDLIGTTKSFHIAPLRERVGAERVAFIHHGYSDEFHRAPGGTQAAPDVDILYIGNAGPAKIAWMTALAEVLPGVSMRLIGAGWSKAARRTSLEQVEIISQRHGKAYAPEIARARIVLAFHNGADPATGFADLVSTRTFEIPACGGFMLHVDNDEVRALYDVPREIETFTTVDNCAAKIRYWLAHPEERAAVAARGHARAVPAYGYAARGHEFAGLIEERLASR